SAKKDPRKYLNGVTLIDGYIVASDAERVFYCKFDSLIELKKAITIPLKAIENIVKKVGRIRSDCLVEIFTDCGDFVLNIENGESEIF
ncbi:hypothetical protein ACG9Y5_20050, partial [Acinetobacter baumannii]